MKNHNLNIQYYTLEPSELSSAQKELLDLAIDRCAKAHAPYSNFKVGAAVKLRNGKVFPGNNQENAAYPSGLCAERVAIFAAKSDHPEVPVESIAIYLPIEDESIVPSPCGACRQVISEFRETQNAPIEILIANREGKVWVFRDVRDLLPFSFRYNHLKIR